MKKSIAKKNIRPKTATERLEQSHSKGPNVDPTERYGALRMLNILSLGSIELRGGYKRQS